MNKILALIIISLLPILAMIILSSIPEPLTIAELRAKNHSDWLYVEQNVNHIVTEREFSAVMRLANEDIKRAVEIFNDQIIQRNFMILLDFFHN